MNDAPEPPAAEYVTYHGDVWMVLRRTVTHVTIRRVARGKVHERTVPAAVVKPAS